MNPAHIGHATVAPPVGGRVIHPLARTLTNLDNSWYTLLTMNTAPHFDHEFWRDTEFGRSLMNSTFTLAVAMGIVASAFPGFLVSIDRVKLVAPVFGGDTLSVETTVREHMTHEDGSRGVRLASIGRNQAGVTVIEVDQSRLDGDASGIADFIAQRAAAAPRLPAGRRHTGQIEGPRLDDFTVGDWYDHGRGRTMLADESLWMALLSMSSDPMSFDRHAAKGAGLADLLVEPTFVLSTVLGLSVMHTTQRAVANLGWHDVRFHHPVHPGDTLYAETEVIETRRSVSRPNQGVVRVRTYGRNQRDQLVVSYERSFLTPRVSPCRARSARPANVLDGSSNREALQDGEGRDRERLRGAGGSSSDRSGTAASRPRRSQHRRSSGGCESGRREVLRGQ